jgi:hypothetical protein
MNLEYPLTQRRLARILEVLKTEDMNIHEVALALPLSVRWTKPYLDHLADGTRAHVVRWEPFGANNTPIAVYRGGPGENVPKPEPKPGAQKAKEFRRRLRRDPLRRDLYLVKRRARERKVKPDPLVVALFGMEKAAA